MDSGEKTPTPISLEKLLKPAMDCSELLQTKKKMFASSCFYAPTHPTVEDQVELARRISYSLSDAKNMKSKGQSMYVNRKKRSVKWIHDGNGSEPEEEPQTPVHKDKVPLKCMMNPNGKVLDISCIQALGEEPNIGTSPINADKLFDIVRDLNNHKGRGAEIFAKRRKRSEKWVVDKEQPSTPTQNYPKAPTYPSKMDYGANENSNFSNLSPLTPVNPPPQNDSKPFFNPFTMDLSLDNGSSQPETDRRRSRNDQRRYDQEPRRSEPEVKKIYLREVAVGTEPDYSMNGHHHRHHHHQNGVEKSRRMSFESDSPQQQQYKPHRSSKHQQQQQQQQNYANYPKSMHHQNYSRSEGTSRESHYVNHRNGHPRSQQPPMEEEDVEDYTPVPVKQLIQEFEKTCRPILQYKQMSAKVAPVVQQPMDDISRFFDGPRSNKDESRNGQKHARNSQNNRGNANGKMAMNGNMVQNGKMIGMNGNSVPNGKMMNHNGHQVINGNQMINGQMMNGNQMINGQMMNGNQMINGQMINGNQMINAQMTNGNQMINGNHQMMKDSRVINGNAQNTYSRPYQAGMVPRYTYDSTDDEIDDSFGESSSSDNCQEYYGPSPGFSSGNRASTMSDYDYRRQLFDCATDQLFTPSDFREADEKFLDTEATPADHAKALNFAMIASQDDIVEQIKQLRRTPIVENLVPGPSPDRSKLGDVVPELANKMFECTYNGPKPSTLPSLANYNTAPRGWDQSQAIYRPVTFRKQEPIAYSDF